MSTDTDEVLALERGFWTEAHNPEFYREHMADDALTVIEQQRASAERVVTDLGDHAVLWRQHRGPPLDGDVDAGVSPTRYRGGGGHGVVTEGRSRLER